MAYKKYIERNGKIYGPYYYESKRVNGKVVSNYHGVKKSVLSKPVKASEAKKSENIQIPKKLWTYLVPALILTILLLIFLPKINLTGQAVVGLQGEYIQGQPLQGKIDINLKHGEFIPANTKVIIENNNQIYEYFLSEITNAQPTTGDYYIEGSEIYGQGLGFGEYGEIIEYPQIYFKLQSEIIEISSEPTSSEESIPVTPQETTSQEIEPTQENTINQTPTENQTQIIEPQETENQTEEKPIPTETPITPEETPIENETEQPIENPSEETPVAPEEIPVETTPSTEESQPTESELSPITGNIIQNIAGGIANFFVSLSPTGRVTDSNSEIQADLNYEKPYVYNLKTRETLTIIPGTVSTESETIDESYINIQTDQEKSTFTTTYKIGEHGFGEEFVTKDITKIPIDFTELNLTLQEGELKITLEHEGTKITSVKTNLKQGTQFQINQEPIIQGNITIPVEQEKISKELKLHPLTDEERIILLEKFGQEKITQEAIGYKDKIIIKLSIGEYSIEYSYQENLDKELLNYYIERDKINWLKDISYNLEQEKAIEKPLTNLSINTNLF